MVPASPSAAPTPPGTSPSRSTPSTQTPSEIEDLKLIPTTGASGALLTLTGIPVSGVEANCWLLDGYLLVGVPAHLLGSGQRITLNGRVEPDLMTTCQQGIPLLIQSADPT